MLCGERYVTGRGVPIEGCVQGDDTEGECKSHHRTGVFNGYSSGKNQDGRTRSGQVWTASHVGIIEVELWLVADISWDALGKEDVVKDEDDTLPGGDVEEGRVWRVQAHARNSISSMKVDPVNGSGVSPSRQRTESLAK